MTNKVNTFEIKNKIKERWNDEYTVLTSDIYSSLPIEVLHNKCGKINSVLFSNMMKQKCPCRYCNVNSKKNTDIYKYQLEKKFPDEYSVIGEYSGASNKIDVIHNSCDTKFSPNATALLRGVEKCPYCSSASNIVTTDIFIKKMKAKYHNEYTLISDYTNAKSSVILKHNNCGYIYDGVIPSEFLNKEACLCPVCHTKSKMQNTESFSIKISNLYGSKYELIGEYDLHSVDIKLMCNECCKEFSTTKNAILNGTLNCPSCGDHFSYSEKFFRELMRQLGDEYKYQCSSKTFNWCQKYRYDFYLYNKNAIVELHGSQHYDIQNNWYNGRNDIDKYELALKNGITDYIVIDASVSSMEFLKTQILSSKLNEYYDLSNINWKKCHYSGQHSISIDIYKLYDDGASVDYIKNVLNISKPTIYRYLKNRVV